MKKVRLKILLALMAFNFILQPAMAQENIIPVNNDNVMHAEPWAFGHSEDRHEAIWHKGVEGKSMLPRKKTTAKKEPEQNSKQSSLRSSLGVSMKDETGVWKVTPSQKNIRPDEGHVRENKHVLGAYAGVQAGDDFGISVGPELIIRDDSKGDDSAYVDQPDSVWGLGMKFKYDF